MPLKIWLAALFCIFTLVGPIKAAAETAILAGGCFWCVEANFEGVDGVKDVVSGYTGGTGSNPTYKDHEKTGHLEAVKITFDAGKVSYGEIVRLFLHSSDVADAGGQFCDRGPSYTTAIFAQNKTQRAAAEAEVAKAERELGRKIVTPVRDAGRFWKAEDYHQDYYKGEDWVLTRRGPKTQASAYEFYRKACGRDVRVRQLWGDLAEFVH